MFGNKIKVVLCASAPMPKDLADDFKIFLSIPVVEGLGMTELSGSAFCTNYNDLTNNTAGGVTSGAILRISDVKDLNYTHKDVIDGHPCPAGEICLKGPLIFVGYYKNDEETNKSFDKDGFFHTGDVGRIYTNLGNGLRIVDRVKEIFKLSQGEYIIPAKLEGAYQKSKFINQLMIYGNSSKNNIIGIINPNLKTCAEALEVEESEIKNMVNDKKLKDLIINDLDVIAKEANFNSLEKVKYIIIDLEGFTIENECLTPTLKVVRKKVEIYFKDKIDALYKTIPIKK
jgi:long-chain acyl-CoA synthetase